METIKGPAIFIAQFLSDKAPFDRLDTIASWAAGHGYKGIQIPVGRRDIVDLEQLAESPGYAEDFKGELEDKGVAVTELSTHALGQLLVVHPAYDRMFDGFAPPEVRGNPAARAEWAEKQLRLAAKASANLGLKRCPSFSGSLLWHTMYPWPPRPAGLVEEGFKELARRWVPVLNAFDESGVDVCYELHPGEDLHDGATFERFLEATDNHSRANILYDPSHFVLQQLDYLQFIDFYHPYIKSFHVKDAEFRPNGRTGVYGGYLGWTERAGRFRSLGDGQVDFKAVFSKLTQYGFPGWAVLEWECCLKDQEQGAKEGAAFIRDHIIKATDIVFDDFAAIESDDRLNKDILGLD